MTNPHLYHFKPAEFNRDGTNWHPKTCPRLLVLMDLLRHNVNAPVIISPHPRAVGRTEGGNRNSQHRYDRWGQVRGVDFYIPGVRPDTVISLMKQLGFTGIGFYPAGFLNNQPQPRYHGDTRRDRVPGEPAEWGYVDGKQVSIKAALESLR